MSDTTMREAILSEFTYDTGVQRLCRVSDMADEIVHLRAENTALKSAVERVRALHQRAPKRLGLHRPTNWCLRCGSSFPCCTLRALEGTP